MSSPETTLFIGDVHGCIHELEELLRRAGYNQKMQLVLVGDLINKGPDSASVLELAKNLGAKVVLGNHEIKFLQYIRDNRTDSEELEAIKRNMGASLHSWQEWLESWPLYLETPDWLVVHAGIAPGKHPRDTSSRLLTKMRTWDGSGQNIKHPDNPPWYHFYKDRKLVVFGHWAMRGLVLRSNAIGLDTGCVYGGHLTAVSWPDKRFYQVKAHTVYCDPLARD